MPSADATRERILDAVSPLLYREGMRGVGVDALVAATGLGKATVYRHFGSKDLLVEAFLRRRDLAWRRWLAEAVDERTGGGEAPILAVFGALGEWFASADFRGCAFINTAAEIALPGHPALEAVREHKRLLREYLRSLADAQGARDPDALADDVLLLVEGAIVTAQIEGSPAAAERARRAAAILVGSHTTKDST